MPLQHYKVLRGPEGFTIPKSISDYIADNSYSGNTRQHDVCVVVDAQAMISMEELIDALLPLNLVPLVVPEFKGITLGGSIQGIFEVPLHRGFNIIIFLFVTGLAGESSSFLFGLFHHAVVGFEVLLSNGTLIWCSETSNSDLYYGLPGTNGNAQLVASHMFQLLS